MSRRIALSALAALAAMLAACTPAPDLSPLESTGGAIVAAKIRGEPPLDPDHANWDSAAPAEAVLYPQTAVPPAAGAGEVTAIQVQALHNGEVLAVRLEWNDPLAAKQRGIGRFADAAAVQWPMDREHDELPYVGMGQPGNPVAVWLWRASGEVQNLAAEGFGTLTAQPDETLAARGEWRDGTWRVVFRRPLSGPESAPAGGQALLPVALAAWNGEDGERNGMKHLSPWRVVYLEGREASTDAMARLADRPAAGNPQRGKALMAEKGCAACHAYPDNPAQPAVGPNLTYAGGVHRSDYLRQSVTQPSAVIVPGKGYSTETDGGPVSLMPPLQGTEQEVEDLVAYLATLRH
ncbi:MAG: c-type cytochrome [Gammaproteobacteria bacterium]|nr:c-type cytochrome [Gammaproteobacteria bacterium]NIR99014.1 c-type cytochrome [Gammaproteobacteria bacterium]NIT64640.1 c-type cytochrome [Gammaproteobacteria bacterium]NIV21613.1 c-type cytochrome [Gammaproteobacteria bacterium]NIY33220.1 c-type cytochrome [Gammaproteobacteria bacterium]